MVIGGLSFNNKANAQVGIRVNVNLGSGRVYVPAPPPPQPVIINEPVYDDYYYLPEVEAYYRVGERCYYYNDGGRWITAAYLPGYYRNYDWRTARRYVVHANRPYLRHDAYRGRFGGYVNREDFYARAYPNRGREQYSDRGRQQYDDRYNNDRGRGQGNYGQPNRGNDRNDQPGRNQGSYGQPNRGGDRYEQPNRNQGGYGQSDRGRGGDDRQDRGRDNDRRENSNGNGQPARNMGQGGSYGDHFAANRAGGAQDRGGFGRPVRQ
ncbi:hypothetical protein GCM10028827_26250 [Mucilaginibacter myungsuensis]